MDVEQKTIPPPWIKSSLPNSALGYDVSDAPPSQFTTFLGFNWAAFSKDLKQLGGFDTRFGPGSAYNATGQEHDMQLRLLNHGFEGLGVPKATVSHYVPSSVMTLQWVLDREMRGGIQAGIRSEKSLFEVCGSAAKRCVISSLVFLKGLFLTDPVRCVSALVSVAHHIGLVKGKYKTVVATIM